ncbi:MAG: restriction endonuclease subunit S [Planctomyces sp.]
MKALKDLTDLVPNANWASLPLFDRTGWTRVRFGDVVENVNETERSPAEAGIDRFIAMEHLEPGSLHVREWGNVADGTTFTRRCRPGQVLFGKRRAYQRKVAVAEFDAVVSGDIYVLAPKDDRLIPELLPFLCLSERFFQHAVGTSAGSLSPRTNWSSLASFELDLPPLDQQRRIGEILWAMDASVSGQNSIRASTESLQTAQVEAMLMELADGPCRSLEDVLTGSPESGCSAPPSSTNTGHFVLSLAALTKSGYVTGNLKMIPPTKEMLDCRLQRGDFLISRSNTQELVGLVGIFNENRNDVSFPDTMMRLPVDESIVDKRFLEIVLQSRAGRLHMMRTAAGTSSSMKKINRRSLRTFSVPTPSLEIQRQVVLSVGISKELHSAATEATTQTERLKAALTQLICDDCNGQTPR